MGNIVTFQNGWYNYELPVEPRREEEIGGYNLPKKEQMWRIPPRLDFKTASPNEKFEYIRVERERWLQGYWFFNKGVPTYVTGMHYDHMVNMRFSDFGGDGRARYFDQQRLDFYMRDLVRKDKNCYGTVWFKPRRYGMTAEEQTNAIYVGMEDFKHFVGLTSITGRKAVETLMRPIVDAIIHRPKYMRPKFYKPSGKKPRSSMEFTEGQIDFDEDGMMEEFATLGGIILPYNTVASAMDAKKEHYIVMDEVWKWKTASPQEALGVNRKCVEDFGINGKISMLSTMGDSDDVKEAIKEGIKIGDDSNPNVRNANGRTTSGLYRYFVGAEHSKVLPADFTDAHGFVNRERAIEYIMNERASMDPNSKEYLYEVRRMPLTYEEAVASADSTAVFDNKRLAKRRIYLSSLPIEKKPYKIGFLDEDNRGLVSWRPDNKGIWKIAGLPFVSLLKGVNMENCYRKMGNKIRPPRLEEYCFGYDPVRYADKMPDNKSISKPSILIRKVFDYFGGGNVNKYVALMNTRLGDAHDVHRECMKAAKFWGMRGMHERQVESVEEDFLEEQMEEMLMINPKDGKRGIWTDGQRRVVKNGVEMIQADMKVTEDGHDPVDDIPFEEMIIDRMEFDPTQTQKSDITMSDIMLHNGIKQLVYVSRRQENSNAGMIRAAFYPKRN